MVTFIYCDFIAYFGRAGDFSRQFYLTNSTSWIAVEVNNRQHFWEDLDWNADLAFFSNSSGVSPSDVWALIMEWAFSTGYSSVTDRNFLSVQNV